MPPRIRRPRLHPGQSRRHQTTTLFGDSVMTEVDTRLTPEPLFRALDAEFHFTVDAAADDDNALCARYWTLETNGLAQGWDREVVWCNPPYSDLLPWVKKAHDSPGATVVMLLPANRTEQGFWQTYVEPHRDRGGRLSTRFLAGRLKFRDRLKPESGGAPFASVLCIWRPE